MMNETKIEIGEYSIETYKKGYNETAIDCLSVKGIWKNGDVFYQIRTDEEGWMDVALQEDAEIISRLIRIERLLKRVV